MMFLLLNIYGGQSSLHKIELENRCVEFEQFSDTQKNVILQTYLAGFQSGYGYTLAAIAWHESCAGEYRINFQDPSAGLFHAFIPSVFKRHSYLKENGFTQNMVGHRLVTDDDFSIQIVLEELTFWERVHSGNWKNIVKSYNRGYSWQSSKKANQSAEEYYQSIASKVKVIQQYIYDIKIAESIQKKLKLPIYQQRANGNLVVLK